MKGSKRERHKSNGHIEEKHGRAEPVLWTHLVHVVRIAGGLSENAYIKFENLRRTSRRIQWTKKSPASEAREEEINCSR